MIDWLADKLGIHREQLTLCVAGRPSDQDWNVYVVPPSVCGEGAQCAEVTASCRETFLITIEIQEIDHELDVGVEPLVVSVVNAPEDPGPGFEERHGLFFVASFVPTPNGPIVWGTGSGSPRDPDWFRNLRAADVAEVQAPGGLKHYEIVDVRYV
mgnify:CR=1 FL=1